MDIWGEYWKIGKLFCKIEKIENSPKKIREISGISI